MLRFIKTLLIFLIFTIIFYVVLVILWGDFSPIKKNLNYKIGPLGHTFTRLNELKNTKNIDILFLGSSHTYRGFDTRIFSDADYESFNMGSNSQTPIQTELLLNKYLDSLNPKIVIFEVCPLVFSLDGIESSLEFVSNGNIDLDIVKMAFHQNHLKIYNTLIYALYREILHDDKNNYEEARSKKNDTYIDGGFVEIKLFLYKHESFEKQKWNYNKDQFKSLKNIANLINERNIELILVQAPVTSDLYNSYTNNPEFDNEIRKYGDYYNFNELLQLNDTIHFFDYHHLNKNGIKIFNKRILDLVGQNDTIQKLQ